MRDELVVRGGWDWMMNPIFLSLEILLIDWLLVELFLIEGPNVVGFVGLTISALWNELSRNATKLQYSISGVILSAKGVGGGIIKTDNAHVLLFDPKTLELVASQIINPFLPPLTFSVGQDDTRLQLRGSYRLLVLTDKDGNPNRSSPGEVIGQLTPSIPLGTERVEYSLDRPFISLPTELLAVSI